MSCGEKIEVTEGCVEFDLATDPVRCKCQGAVLNTYSSLLKSVPHNVALEAAQIVYGHHHPEDCKGDRAITVERWVNASNFH
jgi:hypothetical protein